MIEYHGFPQTDTRFARHADGHYQNDAYFRDLHVLIVDLRDDFGRPLFRHTAERGFEVERLGKRMDRHGYLQVGMTDTASSTPIARLRMRQ